MPHINAQAQKNKEQLQQMNRRGTVSTKILRSINRFYSREISLLFLDAAPSSHTKQTERKYKQKKKKVTWKDIEKMTILLASQNENGEQSGQPNSG